MRLTVKYGSFRETCWIFCDHLTAGLVSVALAALRHSPLAGER